MSNVHLVIPDCQIRHGDDFGFLRALGNYIVAKRPDTIICLGDFADMPSLSSYDIGKKSFEGRRYSLDIAAAREAMQVLLQPLKDFNTKAKKNKEKLYHPRMVLTMGNHEHRINRAVENDSKLEGVLSTDNLQYKEFGWEVSHPAFMGARGTLEIRFNRIARDKTEISILTQDNQSFISLEKWQQIADRCGQSETTLSRT